MASLDALLLCDSATRDAQSGKWTLGGIFDVVWVARFPAVHEALDVYFRMRAVGASPVRLSCRAPGGATIVSVPVPMTASAGAVDGSVRVVALPLDAPGAYVFELYAGDTLLGSTTLTASQLRDGATVH